MNDTNKKTTIENADTACQENHFQKACRRFRELEWDSGRGTTDSSFTVLEYCWKHKEVDGDYWEQLVMRAASKPDVKS